jgi:hypothetical protein
MITTVLQLQIPDAKQALSLTPFVSGVSLQLGWF